MRLLRRYALFLQRVIAAASEGHGSAAESFETVDDVLARWALSGSSVAYKLSCLRFLQV